MQLTQFEYTLPEENIAHSPTLPRDHARLLLLNKNTRELTHKHFYDLPKILNKNDVLVLNNTKVFPARIYAGKIEVLLLQEVSDNTWTALHRGKVKVGDTLRFSNIEASIVEKKDYEITIQFSKSREEILAFIEAYGNTPLPPYIQSTQIENELRDEYQTVYAKHIGSVAAPTAGLHFTKELLQSIKEIGVQIEYVTLHVGAGTFLPIKNSDITQHKMHSERFAIEPEVVARLNEAKINNKRIISVGTTTTRVLETISNEKGLLNSNKLVGETDIYIFPPYKFKFIDAIITNFHLPHSTLLALVSAVVSSPNTSHLFTSFADTVAGLAYQAAIKAGYKFYSFGDGMLIH